jgi:hypothetical protein
LAASAALVMIEQLGEMTSSIGDRLAVAARCPERCRFLVIFASVVAYALTKTLIVAENAHDRAEHGLALGGVRLIGIAAGAGIVLTFEAGRAAVELQHG